MTRIASLDLDAARPRACGVFDTSPRSALVLRRHQGLTRLKGGGWSDMQHSDVDDPTAVAELLFDGDLAATRRVHCHARYRLDAADTGEGVVTGQRPLRRGVVLLLRRH